jgi:tRNA threonylcarbamoyladenosine biosynthesis protein TsaB
LGHSGGQPKGRVVEYTMLDTGLVILAIDTTTRGGSVAVTRDDERLSLVGGDDTRTYGERLPGEIARALEEAGLAKSAIDLIAVAAGPGAFTGLRIGLAAAQGLALTLDRPVVGVSALDALAWLVIDPSKTPHQTSGIEFIVPWMDAQRGDVFAALYRPGIGSSSRDWSRWTVIDEPLTARPALVIDSWQSHLADRDAQFIGDAVLRDANLIAEAGKGRWRTQAPDPLAPAIASLGRRLAAEGRAGKPHQLTPIYVRRPDAEIERERRRSS